MILFSQEVIIFTACLVAFISTNRSHGVWMLLMRLVWLNKTDLPAAADDATNAVFRFFCYPSTFVLGMPVISFFSSDSHPLLYPQLFLLWRRWHNTLHKDARLQSKLSCCNPCKKKKVEPWPAMKTQLYVIVCDCHLQYTSFLWVKF